MRMPANSRNQGVLNEIHRVSRARIFRQTDVGKIRFARGLVENHVFQHRPKADRAVNLRLLFFGQVYAFGVASAFKIENPFRAPAVLVVADQPPRRVSRQRRLARA